MDTHYTKIMSRKIIISTYEGNTHWSAECEDSYGAIHHLGYYDVIDTFDIHYKAGNIWENEVEPKEDLLGKAIAECIKMDKERGVEPNLD